MFEDYARDFLADPDLDRALRAFFDFTITSMTTGEPARGCLTTKTAIDSKADGERINAALRRLLDGLEDLVRDRLSAEDTRLALPAADAARVLVTMTRGIVVMERVHQDPDRLRATARSLIDMVLAGRRRADPNGR
ncbi:LmrA/YxaF family transcription factor [Amycolatopsis rifamycinica]|uniref:Transcriptional regulator LmrA/YxaF-like C-terminal domain-containing protein n=1 Tax=Amycolatopsis rifamycinica TaxID=287986 RepID=A0A066TV36_9PSEU|nr:hypothetical protein [Amycolatopsis rifamycinica]KDN18685.1 hypothetical protein DV20_29270 [Amycolatopsis rifamycinica]